MVILTYYLNLSQYHTRVLLQIPVGTVKSRLSSALKQLRKVLGKNPLLVRRGGCGIKER